MVTENHHCNKVELISLVQCVYKCGGGVGGGGGAGWVLEVQRDIDKICHRDKGDNLGIWVSNLSDFGLILVIFAYCLMGIWVIFLKK